MATILEETKESLARMQNFDIDLLARTEELGTQLNFTEVLPEARKLVGLYNQLTVSTLDDLPENFLAQIKQHADADYNKFQQIMEFKPTVDNPTQVRTNLISSINSAYPPAFTKLHQFISYAVSKAVDFQRMENEARATVQAIRDQAQVITDELEESKKSAQKVLSDVRKVAAEQGVSQQAIYFREESENHQNQAEHWRKRTFWLTVILGVYAMASLFFHKLPFIQPENTIEAIQLISSKILIFGVLSYFLFLAAKNFLSHKHNSIVNKHRQNALMTFNAIADAAQSAEGKEIILTHAAACIFGPQDTGYTKRGGSDTGSRSIIEMMPRILSDGEG